MLRIHDLTPHLRQVADFTLSKMSDFRRFSDTSIRFAGRRS
jgi:hypothetical protein